MVREGATHLFISAGMSPLKRVDGSLSVNGGSPYYGSLYYIRAIDGEEQVFKSGPLWDDRTGKPLGRKIRIHRARNNAKRYWVGTSFMEPDPGAPASP